MSTLHVKTGDTVVLLTGDYEDKYTKTNTRRTGKVLEVSAKEGKVIVEGINMVTKHMKPSKAGEYGGIIMAEAPIYVSKVQLVCPKCGKPTRVGHGFEEKKNAAGEIKSIPVRICKKCSEKF